LKALDEAQKADVMQRQRTLLEQRYDLSNRPQANVMMSGGRKPVQGGVRVKLPAGATWDELNAMSPDEIRERGLLPAGFMPLPHVKQATGGQVFPDQQTAQLKRHSRWRPRRYDCSCGAHRRTWMKPQHIGRHGPAMILAVMHQPPLRDELAATMR
jgi:cytochrome c peroxidase